MPPRRRLTCEGHLLVAPVCKSGPQFTAYLFWNKIPNLKLPSRNVSYWIVGEIEDHNTANAGEGGLIVIRRTSGRRFSLALRAR